MSVALLVSIAVAEVATVPVTEVVTPQSPVAEVATLQGSVAEVATLQNPVAEGAALAERPGYAWTTLGEYRPLNFDGHDLTDAGPGESGPGHRAAYPLRAGGARRSGLSDAAWGVDQRDRGLL